MAFFHFRVNRDNAVRSSRFSQLLCTCSQVTHVTQRKFGMFGVLKKLLVFDKHFVI